MFVLESMIKSKSPAQYICEQLNDRQINCQASKIREALELTKKEYKKILNNHIEFTQSMFDVFAEYSDFDAEDFAFVWKEYSKEKQFYQQALNSYITDLPLIEDDCCNGDFTFQDYIDGIECDFTPLDLFETLYDFVALKISEYFSAKHNINIEYIEIADNRTMDRLINVAIENGYFTEIYH